MEMYKNTRRNSGVSAYESGSDFIRVKFKDGAVYLYTVASAGLNNINEMKVLAVNGNGLNTFINQNVRKNYAKKE
jgi:hypothetical protein